jgi:hypothetical protein
MGDASGEATPEASLPFPYRRLYPSLFAFVLAATESERPAELLCIRIASIALVGGPRVAGVRGPEDTAVPGCTTGGALNAMA